MSETPPAHPYLGGKIRHCVSCGSALEYRKWEFDGSMQLCCTRPGCGHVHFLDPKVATGVVAAIDGKAIILRRAHNPGKGLWTFPGGYVDLGEVVEAAAAREAKEEADIDVRVGPLLGVYSYPEMPVILIVYAGEVTGGAPKANSESTALKMVAPDEINYEELAFDTTRAAMKDWAHWIRTGEVSSSLPPSNPSPSSNPKKPLS